MELVFIRHGQGEHTLDLPHSLHTKDPALTENGIIQAELIRNQFPLSEKDVIIISPIRRTLQTVEIWSRGIDCRKIVSPLVSPRMFPLKPKGQTLPCDKLFTKEKIKDGFSDCEIEEKTINEYWSNGINTVSEQEFKVIAEKFLNWCKQTCKSRIYVVSHDGTITSYRQFISGKKLTRNDFPKETDWIIMKY
nr:histidine phosphatase family protein [Litchfieldia salsa]